MEGTKTVVTNSRKNTHFGWMKCGDNVATNFTDSQIKIAEDNIGK